MLRSDVASPDDVRNPWINSKGPPTSVASFEDLRYSLSVSCTNLLSADSMLSRSWKYTCFLAATAQDDAA